VGTIVPALPLLLLDSSQSAGSDGRLAFTLPGGGPPLTLVAQFATFDGPAFDFSNGVQLNIGQ